MKCSIAWSSLYVQANGKVTPCCGDLRFGTTKQSLIDIFNGPEAVKLRTQMLENAKELPDICTNCNLLQRLGADDFPEYVTAESYDAISSAYMKEELPPPGSKPVSLMIQFGELCNIQCIMCPQDHLSPIGISAEAVERVKEAIPTVGHITLTGGEPTAFKQCWDIIDYFNNNAPKGAYLGILTNLKSVTKQRIEKHFSNIDNLGFGINVDAATKGTYEYIRRGASWDQLNRNLTDLLEYRAKAGKKNWRLNLTMTMMKSNLHEMVDCIKWAGRLGIGFGCGPVTGDFGPVKNARTYFEENIFRYPHIGISNAEMVAVFNEALATTACLPPPHQKGARDNIAGMITFANSTKPIEIAPEDVERIRALPDAELSAVLQNIVLNGCTPWYRAELSDTAWWAGHLRRTSVQLLRDAKARITRQ